MAWIRFSEASKVPPGQFFFSVLIIKPSRFKASSFSEFWIFGGTLYSDPHELPDFLKS